MMTAKQGIVVAALVAWAGVVQAGVGPDEAKKLGTTLTRFGADPAGNADGSIPPYTGGLTKAPTGYVKGSGVLVDPFPSEKPLFSIDAKNMDRYADKLTEGAKALLKSKPGFRLDVYTTHRTAAWPDWILGATAKNAVQAETYHNGLSLRKARVGIPFPIPKDGYEVMWNHMVRFIGGVGYDTRYRGYNVDAWGKVTHSASVNGVFQQDYAFKENPQFMYRAYGAFEYPPRYAGQVVAVHESLNAYEEPRRAFMYMPGQRRTRLAPDLAYDMPDTDTMGVTFWDEKMLFTGSMDRFDYKLVGKKEVYVPYNAYRMVYGKEASLFKTKGYPNPDDVRWELHRVWVVEATLAKGKRHVVPKRVFYIDEDGWRGLATEGYDARGQLWKVGFGFAVQDYENLCLFSDNTIFFDMLSGAYVATNWWGEGGFARPYMKPRPDSDFNAESMAGHAVR